RYLAARASRRGRLALARVNIVSRAVGGNIVGAPGPRNMVRAHEDIDANGDQDDGSSVRLRTDRSAAASWSHHHTTRFRRRRPGRVRAWLEYAALRAVIGVLAALPLWVALRMGEFGGFLTYVLDVPHRRTGMRNLLIAFPERSAAERRRIL